MEEFIKLYNHKDKKNLELEIKCRFKKEEEIILFNSLLKEYKQSNTINFISRSNVIKELSYEGIDRINNIRKIYKKNSLIIPLIVNRYKLTLYEEASAEEEHDLSLIRIKRRYSNQIMNNWRLDFTFVKTAKQVNDIETLKILKNQLFNPSRTIDDLFKKENVEIEFEFIGTSIKMHDFDKLFSLIDSILISEKKTLDFTSAYELLRNILSVKYGSTLKLLLPNAIELDKQMYFDKVVQHIDNFIVTDKVDGIRVILFVQPDGIYQLEHDFKLVIPGAFKGNYIFEAECYKDNYYIYDILLNSGNKCTEFSYNERIKILRNLETISDKIHVKSFYNLGQDYQKVLEKVWKEKRSYDVDGLIFSSSDRKYKDTVHYKWKPVQTIDFLVKRCPRDLLGVEPFHVQRGKVLYFLFVGISKENFKNYNIKKVPMYNKLFTSTKDYFPIQFCPSENPNAFMFWSTNTELENNVVELAWDNKEWNLIKIRKDRLEEVKTGKYFGNNYRIAENIWMSYIDKLTFNILVQDKEKIMKEYYFKETSDKFFAVRKFNNFGKKCIIDMCIKNTQNVIDIGAGKGQDLQKYSEARVKNLILLDNNEANIAEIVRRKHSMPHLNLSLYVKLVDIAKCSTAKLEEMLKLFNVTNNTVVCNFAVHYFISTKEKAAHFASLINTLLGNKQKFVVCYIDGRSIYSSLKTTQKWEEGKYYIELLDIKKFTGINQYINIRLPFNTKELTKENITNIDLLTRELKKNKISVELSGGFTEFLDKFKKDKPQFYSQLDDSDKKYLQYIKYIVYYKK